MKTFYSFLMLFCILLALPANSQNYDESECPILTISKKEAQSQTGGLYKPCSNLPGQYFRALIVFVQFEGDVRANSAWEPDELPDWAFDFIDSVPVSEYNDMTVSDYWKEMSMGNFDFIGDVYPELVILPPESYYQQNKNYADCNFDVLTDIDPNVNFSLYDNWKLVSGQFIFSPANADNLVDMIYMIYRNPGESTTPNWFGGFSGISMLGFSPNFITNDGNVQINGGLGSNGSGLTIRTGLSGHYNVMGLCNHEFGHYLFGYDHISFGGIMGGGTYALRGWERERLGYVAYTTVYQDNFTITLTDFISTGSILRIPIPISNPNSINYFLVENHQRLSHYDQITRGGSLNGGWVFQTTVGTGIYITLNYFANNFYNLAVYSKSADGNFDWEVADTMFNSIINGCDLPLFTRTSVNRNLGEPDRTVRTPWYRCDGSYYTEGMWYDKDPIYQVGIPTRWIPTRDRMGDDTDPFSLSNNNLFSPWSNPSSYSPLTGTTNYSVWLYNQDGNNISIQVKTTESSSLSLPPSKPQNLVIYTHMNGHPNLDWDDNIETDLLQYRVYRDGQQIAITTSTFYTDNDISVYAPIVQFDYYVKAEDTDFNLSVASETAGVMGFDKINVDKNIPLKEYALGQNYPNPFNPTTTIAYSIKQDGLVSLKVYDILGTEIVSLANKNQVAGNYSVEFNAAQLPSGIYIYRLTSGNFTASKKLILMK